MVAEEELSRIAGTRVSTMSSNVERQQADLFHLVVYRAGLAGTKRASSERAQRKAEKWHIK